MQQDRLAIAGTPGTLVYGERSLGSQWNSWVGGTRVNLLPSQIAARRFPRRTVGGVDPVAVQSFLAEIAADVDQLRKELAGANHERITLQDSLKQATAKTAELEKRVAAMQDKLASAEQEEGLLKRAFLAAQKFSEDLTQEAKTRAEETITAAIASAEETIASAAAAAEETTRAAEARATGTLDAARKRAEELVQAAERTEAGHLARLQAEVDRVTARAHQQAIEITQHAEQHVGSLVSTVEAFATHGGELARSLEALVGGHAELAKIATRLRTEVLNEILPEMKNLLQQLKEQERASLSSLKAVGAAFSGPPVEEAPTAYPVSLAAEAPADEELEWLLPAEEPAPPAAAPVATDVHPGAVPASLPAAIAEATTPPLVGVSAEAHSAARLDAPPVPASEEHASPHPVSLAAQASPGAVSEAVSIAPEPAPSAPAPGPSETPGPGKRSKCEIVVSPISTYSQAAIFLRSLLQIKGVKDAKLRKYTLGSTATFEVTTSYGTFGGGGIQLVGEFPVEVVEASDARMVLRIANGGAPRRTA